MKFHVRRIDPFTVAKVSAVVYGFISLLMIPFLMLPALFGRDGMGFSLLFTLLMPVLHITVGFLGGLIGTAFYNLAAGWFGGIEMELERYGDR